MDTNFYLLQFQQAAHKLDRKLLVQKKLQAETGIWLNSVILRLYKQHWANGPFEQPQTGPAIFFSTWINASFKEHKLFYNIHALKLRKLNSYTITSRKFASDFREQFKSHEHNWPNVSTKFGPLTLMQGWKKVNLDFMTEDIFDLANEFMKIDILIDDLLGDRALS